MATDHSTQSLALLPDQPKILDDFAELIDAYEAIVSIAEFDDPEPEIILLRALNKNFRMLLDSPQAQPYLT